MTRRTRVAAYGLALQDDALLLVRLGELEPDRGEWTLPGGGVEFGEHPEDGVRREFLEETGLTVEVAGLAGVDSEFHVFPDAEMHAIRLIYHVRVVGGSLRPEANGWTDAVEWVPVRSIGDVPHVTLVAAGVRCLAPK